MYYVPNVELFNLTIPMTFLKKGNFVSFGPQGADLNEFLFQTHFRTLKGAGLILMVQTVTLGYLLVYLEGGFVTVVLSPSKTGDRAYLQSHSGNLNDNTDHSLKVRVSRHSNKVDLYLNGNLEVSAAAGIHGQPLSKIEHLCLGGLSPKVKGDAFNPSLYTYLTFKGCIIEPTINGADIIGPAYLHDTIYGCVEDIN